MGAPRNAITLKQESDPKWWKEHSHELPSFTCNCGYQGHAGELLVDPAEDGETTMWCPVCTSSGWVWD